MDFNAKDVVLVFAVVKEVGLVSAEETVDYLKKELKAELDIGNVKIILERLRAKDILTIDQNLRYKVAKIPVPWMSLKMDLVKKFRMKDFKKSVEDVDNMFPSAETIVPQPKGMYKNYILMEVEFEAIDRILGGVPKGEKEPLQVHRNAKKQPVVSAGQMYGWFRENERLIGANAKCACAWVDRLCRSRASRRHGACRSFRPRPRAGTSANPDAETGWLWHREIRSVPRWHEIQNLHVSSYRGRRVHEGQLRRPVHQAVQMVFNRSRQGARCQSPIQRRSDSPHQCQTGGRDDRWNG